MICLVSISHLVKFNHQDKKESTVKLRFVLSIAAAIVLLFSAGAFASQGKAANPDLVNEVYAKSGLARQIPAMTGQTAAYLQAYRDKMPPEVLALLRKELDKFLTPEILEKNIKMNIANSVGDNTIQHVLKWLETPLGKKITKLEEDSSTQEATLKTIQFIQTTDITKLPQKRIELVKKLDEAGQMTELAVDLGITVGISVLDTLNNMNPETPPISKEKIRELINGQRAQMKQEIQRQTLLGVYYGYQSLTDEEIQKYIDFLNLKTSKVFNDAITKALLRSASSRSEIF